MKCPHQAHVAIVDGERFVLMRNTGQIFEPKLEKVAQPELERTNYSAGTRLPDQGNQRAGRSSTDIEELAYGAAVAEWLNSKTLSGEIEQLIVIADPRTLGEMRRHYHKELEPRIVAELAKDLTGQSTREIEKAIAAA